MSNVFQVFDLLKEKICPKIIDKHDTISNINDTCHSGGWGGGELLETLGGGVRPSFPKPLLCLRPKSVIFHTLFRT